MKNLDNVEIKVGQEWNLNNGWIAFPLAFHNGGCLCYLPALKENCYRNYASTCFATLIGCVHCGAGDDAHHSFGCPGDMHPDKVPEPEKPKYMLFEIDWSSGYPQLASTASRNPVADIGVNASGCRIFGYTDNDSWCESAVVVVNHDYFTTPCDHTGNRKYAIGRLEA